MRVVYCMVLSKWNERPRRPDCGPAARVVSATRGGRRASAVRTEQRDEAAGIRPVPQRRGPEGPAGLEHGRGGPWLLDAASESRGP